MSEETQHPPIPYVSFETIKGFVDNLAKMDGAVPDHVDRSILRGKSGSVQAAMLAALRFLGLIENDDAGTVRPAFGILISAKRKGEAEWRAALKAVVEHGYADILATSKLASATPEKVNEAFRAKGVKSVEMLEKSVRFYIKACEEAGIAVSPLLKARKPRSKISKPREKPPQPKVPPGGAAPHLPPDEKTDDGDPPVGYSRLPIPGRPPEVYIQYPDDLTETDCLLFEAQIATLRILLKARSEKGVAA
jgi:hypothetical protein